MKITRFFLTFWLVAILISLPGISAGKAQALPATTGSTPDIALLPDGISLGWHVQPPERVINSAGEVEIRIPGYEQSAQPGEARLPSTSVLIALPRQANPVLEIQQTATDSFQLDGPLAVNPVQPGEQLQESGRQVNRGNTWLVLEEIGSMRGIRLARLTFYPVNPNGSRAEWVSQLKATIHYQTAAPQTGDLNDALDRLVQSQVVNPAQVESVLAANLPGRPLISSADTASATAVLELTQAGVYQVTYASLAAAGFPVNQVNPLHLKLTHAGQEIAYEWAAAQDSIFSPGETLRFYAQPSFSRWSATDTYLLTETSLAGKTIPTRSAEVVPGMTPGKAWIEQVSDENQIYTPDCLDCGAIPLSLDGDRWTWARLAYPDKTSDWFEFFASDVNPSQTASFTSWWIGYTDVDATPDHKVNVTLNGTLLGAVIWDGKTAAQSTLAIPAGVLHSGSNVVAFDVPAIPGIAVNGVWLDAFKVRYQAGSEALTGGGVFTGEGPTAHTYQVSLDNGTGALAYDVSDPLNPVHLNGYTQNGATLTLGDATGAAAPVYLVVNAGGILSPQVHLKRSLTTANETWADYVILAGDGYTPALASLIALRQSQGLKVVVENLQAIYDEYNAGRMDPQAIYTYLKSTYQNWKPAPQYVLLVGDGTIDPKHYRSDSFNTILPAMIKPVDPYAVEIASDNRYVTLDSDSDNLPDMIVGRLPANTPAEAAAMVNKIVQYETAPVPGLWHGLTTFVADNQDAGGDFAAAAARVSQFIPGPYFAPQKLFYGVNISNPVQMHSALMNAWDLGSSLMVYVGHAAQVLWAQELFLHVNDLPGLTNGQKLPVVLEMTCFTGNFAMASLSSIDEALVRQASGGAIAAWGSSNVGISSGHEYLAQGFLQSLTRDHPGQLGLATLSGRLNLATSGSSHQYLIDTYILFGDPATRVTLNFMPAHWIALPVVTK
jgi:hypothetical protein